MATFDLTPSWFSNDVGRPAPAPMRTFGSSSGLAAMLSVSPAPVSSAPQTNPFAQLQQPDSSETMDNEDMLPYSHGVA